MAQDVKLFKKNAPWTDKDGVVHNGKNLYVQCGDVLIPVRVANFSTDEKRDEQYRSRRAVFEAFAEELPERDKHDPESPAQENVGNTKSVSHSVSKNAADDVLSAADPF